MIQLLFFFHIVLNMYIYKIDDEKTRKNHNFVCIFVRVGFLVGGIKGN